ncbi:Uma2 family endonuclease [Nocardia sp. NPDC050406]|uniref:Uma2 family endonuclease n=1 Tax=Nocardia sp. NPDC050406 TaxID=3364318 RepID=UPI0037B53C1F
MRRSRSAEAVKMVGAWPDHLLTMAEWSALREDGDLFCELVDGVPVVAPQPPRHQLAVWRLAAQLEPSLPAPLAALARIELVVEAEFPATVRIPDVLVVGGAAGAAHASRVQPSEVLAAIEILSPGSRRVDRIMKPAEYAAVGIEHYWLLDPEGTVRLTAYRLSHGRYEPVGEYRDRVTLDLAGHALPLDLNALTALRSPG